MSEEKRTYEADTAEAMDMIGKGYDSAIVDESPHDFYSQIPNMVNDIGLSPYAFRLYGHLRRVAGEEGRCWRSTKTLAQECSMSAGSVSNAKQELLEACVPLIRVKKIPMRTGFSYDEITITDLWKINHDVYQKSTVHLVNGSPHERAVHQVKQRISLLKNNPITTTTTAQPAKSNAFTLYEQNIGPLTPHISETLTHLMIDYSEAWLNRAILEAAEQNVRKIKYISAVLEGYRERGSPDIGRDKVKATPKRTPAPTTSNQDIIKRMAQDAYNRR
jgi:hypothetical protein